MVNRTNSQWAYVLHRYDWSETSLIVDVFTRESGRVTLAAKGAKRPYSQLRGVLLPFQRLQVSWSQRRGDDSHQIATLKTAEWAGRSVADGPMVLLQGQAMLTAFYLNELILKFLPRQAAQPMVFDAYDHTLPALAHGDTLHVHAALRAFELFILRDGGHLPALDCTTLTQQSVGRSELFCLRSEGGLIRADGDPLALPGSLWQALEIALNNKDLGALQRAALAADGALKVPLRSMMQYHLGHQTMRTRALMLELQP